VQVTATIDATRRKFVQEGEQLISGMLRRVRHAREQLAQIDGIRVMGREVLRGDARFAWDETKLYFDITGLGLNG
jgi:hypothetical protein